MNTPIIGRKKELQILEEALYSNEAEMVAVLGRRRVGKTFLVSSAYKTQTVFEISGVQGATMKQQLRNFRDELAHFTGGGLPLEIPSDWLTAFQMLKQYLLHLNTDQKKVIFFDEVPWLSGHKSGFLEALGYFWNSWASRQSIVVVICGSAASWMIRRVVHDKGGLHNRITKSIHLKPFTLGETEQFLHSRGIYFDRLQILHLYMAVGGVPHYLKSVKAGMSVVQNIESLCFSETGFLHDEFSKLYPALFKDAERHMAIIRVLAGKWKGMDRSEIIKSAKIASGGGITGILDELEQSGFISAYFPFGKKQKEKVFRLTDPFSLFYLQFIETNIAMPGIWLQISQSQQYKSWAGYAFENICLCHIGQIKKALGISGIFSSVSSFYSKGDTKQSGAQIDLVLDRNDHVINLFEMKFYDEPIVLTQALSEQLQTKRSVFKAQTQTHKQLSWVIIAALGVKNNTYSTGLIDHSFSIDILFDETV